MSLFNVYPRFAITPTHAEGAYVFDENEQKYLDLYGGHGVISIGHSHPHYVEKIQQQVAKIGFYSNSIQMPLQEELAKKIQQLSGYQNHELFFCNSGAEANENALKIASFFTGKKKIIAFKNSFHGRTAASLNVTDNAKLSAPLNVDNFPVEFLSLNNEEAVLSAFKNDDVAAVIVEGIQGVGGLDMPTEDFLKFLKQTCEKHQALLILDEIQSGYGRSGKFFAHQYANIEADLVTMAKGMGNGFPVAGVLIHPKIKAQFGMLGTTFGGNHLACAAGLAVLEVIEKENLLENAIAIGAFAKEEFAKIPQVKQVKGKGLMLGVEFDFPIKELRIQLLEEHNIFTGASANPNLLRILPPLTIQQKEILQFTNALKSLLS
ncbi:acetylornithine aminotransferase [Mesonia phycicola]|uniref:Acetylornithine aminotransferase n=1 Tax=Mesonia phycicola TaxID=579105 RepID=A0A1M6AIK1_9FLAO|nr:aminotransferase class III-fold pyridoxal phosphate-dependent enzyme [Mesonia phycicola]SHI36310.1 acetylornithine aminotransferase [Mesonia phycicola]